MITISLNSEFNNYVSDTQDKIDTILQNMKSYTDEGRKYLYTENK